MAAQSRFHLAFAVDDLARARAFYVGVLGCAQGRSSDTWVDFDLYGHQIVAHLVMDAPTPAAAGFVDGARVPVPHFGLILPWGAWNALAGRLRAAGVSFVIEPHVRFRGEAGEQAVLFIRDPAGNALEFKAFRDEAQIFAS